MDAASGRVWLPACCLCKKGMWQQQFTMELVLYKYLVVGCGSWVVGRGLWVVGRGLWVVVGVIQVSDFVCIKIFRISDNHDPGLNPGHSEQ